MGLLTKERVNLIFTNHALRYSFHKTNSLDSMVTYGELELPKGTMQEGKIISNEVLSQLINKLVSEHKWKRKNVHFAVPDDAVVIRKLDIPAALTNEEAYDYIHTQLGNTVFLPFNEPAIAIDFLEKGNTSQTILLYAYPNEKIAALTKLLDEAGLKPAAADLTSLAVYRYYYTFNQDTKHQHILLIHWNKDALIITAFQNHKAIFSRHMKLSEPLTKQSADHTALAEFINEYILEIRRLVDFYQYSIMNGEAAADLVLLSGDFAHLSAVKKQLADVLTMQVQTISMETDLPVKYSDVLGLALKPEM